MKKYLLSTGDSTIKIEKYILDLFKLYIQVYPGDIPGSNIGFDFILTDTKKDELSGAVQSRVSSLVTTIQNKLSETYNKSIRIEVKSIEILSEERAKIEIDVNDYIEELEVEI